MEQNLKNRITDNVNAHSPLVSVIIPVYKTPVEFISRCIQSVTAQTYPSLEIILIDDGSPASYAAEYQKIAQSDKRIGIIRRQNGGVSAARNDGIKAATGDWCLFVDADDWPEDNLCTDALNAVQKFYMQNGYHTDIVLFPYCKEYGKHTEKISYFKNDFTVNTVESCNTLRTQVLYLESTLGSVWAKLYRREFIKKLSIFQMNVRKPMAYKKKRLTGYLKQYGIIINLPKQVLNPLLIIPENYKGNRYMETKHYKGKPPISPRWVMKKKKSKKY